jgi:hypothetical protein
MTRNYGHEKKAYRRKLRTRYHGDSVYYHPLYRRRHQPGQTLTSLPRSPKTPQILSSADSADFPFSQICRSESRRGLDDAFALKDVLKI